jgi:hypothetical protein
LAIFSMPRPSVRNARMRSSTPLDTIGRPIGLPLLVPFALAFAMPALTRSWIVERMLQPDRRNSG